jgi:hypothetical protein
MLPGVRITARSIKFSTTRYSPSTADLPLGRRRTAGGELGDRRMTFFL